MPDKKVHSITKNQSKEALIEVFFRNHYPELCRSVNRLLADRALSEDLVQEVFIKVWERKEKIDFSDRFIFYLKKSCHHAALAFLSSKPYRLNTDTCPGLTDSNASDQELQHQELQAQVRTAIGQLPEKTRIAFTLSRYEGLTYKEIALALGISTKAVEKHMSIALKKLREALKDHLPFLLTFFC